MQSTCKKKMHVVGLEHTAADVEPCALAFAPKCSLPTQLNFIWGRCFSSFYQTLVTFQVQYPIEISKSIIKRSMQSLKNTNNPLYPPTITLKYSPMQLSYSSPVSYLNWSIIPESQLRSKVLQFIPFSKTKALNSQRRTIALSASSLTTVSCLKNSSPID